jgi:phytoene dehydrogenase-like protein
MGSVSDELAKAERDSDVTIRTGVPVSRIVIDNGRMAHWMACIQNSSCSAGLKEI